MLLSALDGTLATLFTQCVFYFQVFGVANGASVKTIQLEDVSSPFSVFSSTYRCSMMVRCRNYRRAHNKTWSDHGRKPEQYYCAYSWKRRVYCITFDPPPPAFDTSLFQKRTCRQWAESSYGLTKSDEFLYLKGSAIDKDTHCYRPSLLWKLFASDAGRAHTNLILGTVITGLSLLLLIT